MINNNTNTNKNNNTANIISPIPLMASPSNLSNHFHIVSPINSPSHIPLPLPLPTPPLSLSSPSRSPLSLSSSSINRSISKPTLSPSTNNNNNAKKIKSPGSGYKKPLSIEELHLKYTGGYKTVECHSVAKKIECTKDRDCFYYHKKEEYRRPPFDEGGQLLYSHSPCQTKCSHPNCTYSHNDVEIMYHPTIYKTKMCNDYLSNRACKKGRWCAFAHGLDDIRSITNTAKFNTQKVHNHSHNNNIHNSNININSSNNFNSNSGGNINQPSFSNKNHNNNKSIINNSQPTTNNTTTTTTTTTTSIFKSEFKAEDLDFSLCSIPKISNNNLLTSFENLKENHDFSACKYYKDYFSIIDINSGINNHSLQYGKIQVDKKDPFLSIVKVFNSTLEILIDGYYSRNRSLEGDIVAVELILKPETDIMLQKEFSNLGFIRGEQQPQSQQQINLIRYGRVIGILDPQNHVNSFACKFLQKYDHHILFTPFSDSTLFGILIPISNIPPKINLSSSIVFDIKIEHWNPNTPFPIGSIQNYHPFTNDFLRDFNVFKITNKLTQSIQEDVILNDDSNSVRQDLTDLLTFSISSSDGFDSISNAFSITQLPNNSLKIYIHIVDLLDIVKPKSSIDNNCIEKSFQMNLGIETLNILPNNLVKENLSLSLGKERKTITFEITFGDENSKPKVYQSIIKSCCSLSFSEVQDIFNEKTSSVSKKDSFFPSENIISSIKALQRCSFPNTLNSTSYLSNVDIEFSHNNMYKTPLPSFIKNVSLLKSYEIVTGLLSLCNYILTKGIDRQSSSNLLVYKLCKSNSNSQNKHLVDNPINRSGGVGEQDSFSKTKSSLLYSYYISLMDPNLCVDFYSNDHSGPNFYISEFTEPLKRYGDLYNQRVLQLVKFSNDNNSSNNDNNTLDIISILPSNFDSVSSLANHIQSRFLSYHSLVKSFQKICISFILKSKIITTNCLLTKITQEGIVSFWCKEVLETFTINLDDLYKECNIEYYQGSLLVTIPNHHCLINCLPANQHNQLLQHPYQTPFHSNSIVKSKLGDTTIMMKEYDTIQIHLSNDSGSSNNCLIPKFLPLLFYFVQSSPSFTCEHKKNSDLFLHSNKPIGEVGGGSIKNIKFETISHYQDFWTSIIDASSLSKVIPNGSSVFAYNGNISWSKKKKKYIGTLEIPFASVSSNIVFSRGDFICLKFPGDDRNQSFSIHSVISKVDNGEKNPDKIMIRFPAKIEKISPRFPYYIEIIFRDTANKELLNGIQQFCSKKGYSESSCNTIQEIVLNTWNPSDSISGENQLFSSVAVDSSTGVVNDNVIVGGNDFEISNSLFQIKQKYNLNQSQENALFSSIFNPFTMVEGEPGSGKTTLLAIISHFVVTYLNVKLLICGPNNNSLDSTSRCVQNLESTHLNIVRVYDQIEEDYMIPKDQELISLDHYIKLDPKYMEIKDYMNIKERAELLGDIKANVLNHAQIILCTTSFAKNELILNQNVKWVFIDNANQEIEPRTIGALSTCSHAVLFSDVIIDIPHSQVSIKSKKLKGFLKTPLCKRVNCAKPIRLLSFYVPTLFSHLLSPNIKDINLDFDGPDFKKPILSFFNLNSLDKLDIKSFEFQGPNSFKSCYNYMEASFSVNIVRHLLKNFKIHPLEILIISPYPTQRMIIKKTLERFNICVNVFSLEEAQYYHFNYSVVSLVRTEKCQFNEKYWFESDEKIIRKMIFSSRKGLFFVGSLPFFEKREKWSGFLANLKNLQVVESIQEFSLTDSINFEKKDYNSHCSLKVQQSKFIRY
ncbi:hypothetical protein CYY_003617 [Polysphondylium violaceum]|uniref:C3H1-type domain-containing protein n=1 Tax=Polysphondylium violaceum TaxID=133409 RepID=A0A8J4PWK3_9MYCE|nr:hypothetical protein CYY_003617 [Polysphondylium violaceum]